MTLTATVSLCKNEFCAVLSDGRQLRHHDWRGLAESLFCAGVREGNVGFEWHEGQRMVTAGQQVALRAEIRRLGKVVGLAAA